MTDEIKAKTLLCAKLVCPLPFHGKSGSGKTVGCCPHCGADSHSYRYPENSRWKHCSHCGYDRFEEKRLKFVRYEAKHGVPIELGRLNRTLDYHRLVYGNDHI